MKVPVIFVINLDSSVDRLISSELRLKDCGFKFERIPAVNGKELLSDKIEYAIILEDDFAIVGNKNKTISTLNSIDFEWDYIKLATYKKRTRYSI